MTVFLKNQDLKKLYTLHYKIDFKNIFHLIICEPLGIFLYVIANTEGLVGGSSGLGK